MPCLKALLLLTTLALITGVSRAQLTTGFAEGNLRTPDGHVLAGTWIVVSGETGFETVTQTSSTGQFALFLPYGWYRFSVGNQHNPRIVGPAVFVSPSQTTQIDLLADQSGALRVSEQPEAITAIGSWADFTRTLVYPESFSLQGVLASRESGSVTEPHDFAGLADNRLGVVSQCGFSWTDTQFNLAGLDATDSYQPGYPMILPDMQSLGGVVVRTAFALTTSNSYGTEIGLYPRQPDISWHGTISSANTGSALASTNLPQPPERGIVQQAERFAWSTRDQVEAGGPLTQWADFFASGAGQWASQSMPLASPGTEQTSKILFFSVRSQIRAATRDHIDLLYSASHVDLSNGGVPVGMEALTGRRASPEFNLPYGFLSEAEANNFHFLQAGWTHSFARSPDLGVLQVRYGISIAHLDTRAASQAVPDQSRIELFGSTVAGSPPLGNRAVRTRQEIAVGWQPGLLLGGSIQHQITAGAAWKISAPQNRFSAPSDLNLITANGVPAFVVEFNTPLQSRESLRSFTGYLADHVVVARTLSFDVGGLLDLSRGSLPAQSSPAGVFTPARTFAATPDLIVWNSISPRAGLAWQVPHAHGVVIRGMYTRFYSPLAGRYLDLGNPNSLGGNEYQWTDRNANGWFEPAEQGGLLMRFGGPYSPIFPSLKRPYADEFNVSAELRMTRRSIARIHLFRRDEKDRIASINTGVSSQAFTPVSILDPGSDGIVGTFDDRFLTAYQQNSETLGQDRYLLTNPPGLRELNEGLLAEVRTEWRNLIFHASFVAEKAWGPTNPGNAFFENDPGVIGALLLDPNTAINATGHSFTDRAYVGKMQTAYRLPSKWGGMEVASVANYTDGLVFARQLLIADLTQGPFLVAATIRGSPEGGNRAQYVLNWNLRFAKEFSFRSGHIAASIDILNVTNAGQKIQENDLTGPSFNLRLPIAIQPPRFVRIGFRYEF